FCGPGPGSVGMSNQTIPVLPDSSVEWGRTERYDDSAHDYTVLYNWFLYKWGLTPGSTTNMLNVCNQLEFFNGCMASDRGCFAVQNLVGGTDLNNAR
ncbi:hypothetical protein ANCDUO_21863, partial [Ancylostoma duodenale]